MLITPGYPLVVKLGHAHAGFGKMKLDSHKMFEDFKSVVATTNQYCTAEPYLEGVFDVRVQRIGNEIRAFERRAMAGQWKTNTGSAVSLFSTPLLIKFSYLCSESQACGGD
jgi:glutathione synthase/RimK-type ligase-like ATP-grasp enzyme